MQTNFFGFIVAAALISPTFPALAAASGPALVYGTGGKFDKSFNEAGFAGAERFKQETGMAYREFEPQNPSQILQALRRFAKDGNQPIVVLNFEAVDSLRKVAQEFPKTHFAIVDDTVNLPNVASYVFREQEGSYLVGMMAAGASKTGTIGFVGGMDVPLIRRFACGYAQGAVAANPSVKVIENMTGTTPSAWRDPGRGAELAKAEISQGADVIYAAAGTTGIGVLQAAADAGKLGIGVDSNQNYLHPGQILTSMVKRVDQAVYAVFKAAHDGTFEPGTHVLGLKEDGVAFAMDDNNKGLVSDAIRTVAEAAKADIVAGKTTVADYMATSSCPVHP